MSYISTKFCEICDDYYDWSAPECPGCVQRKFWERFEVKFLAAKAVINALPKCDKCYDKLATRHAIIESVTENELARIEHSWRCDECGPTFLETEYAVKLKKFLELE